MNKRDLVVSLSERLSLTQSQSVEIVNAWEGVLTDALQSGERLTLQGFGTFLPGARPNGQDVIPERVRPAASRRVSV